MDKMDGMVNELQKALEILFCNAPGTCWNIYDDTKVIKMQQFDGFNNLLIRRQRLKSLFGYSNHVGIRAVQSFLAL